MGRRSIVHIFEGASFEGATSGVDSAGECADGSKVNGKTDDEDDDTADDTADVEADSDGISSAQHQTCRQRVRSHDDFLS